MADTTENIVIAVTDSVAPSIATKLQTMEKNALSAMDAFTRMQQSIDNIKGDGLQGPAAALKNMSFALKAAETATKALEVAQARLGRVVERVTGTIVKQTAALMSTVYSACQQHVCCCAHHGCYRRIAERSYHSR